MVRFLELSLSKVGADEMITPREMLRDYMTVLNILMQNEQAQFEDLMASSACPNFSEPTESAEKVGTEQRYTVADIEF